MVSGIHIEDRLSDHYHHEDCMKSILPEIGVSLTRLIAILPSNSIDVSII